MRPSKAQPAESPHRRRAGARRGEFLKQHIALDRVARLLDQPRAVLVQLSRENRFPELVGFSQRRQSVVVEDLLAWLRENRVSQEVDRARAEYLKQVGRGSLMPRNGGKRRDKRA